MKSVRRNKKELKKILKSSIYTDQNWDLAVKYANELEMYKLVKIHKRELRLKK